MEKSQRGPVESTAAPLVLVCGADNNYAMPMAVTLYSAIKNYRGRDQVEIFVLDNGISTSNKRKIDRILSPYRVELHWIITSVEVLRGYPVRGPCTISTYLRLLAPNLLPPQVGKAIYLDCDTLVEADLNELWQEEIFDNYFLAVPNTVNGENKLIGDTHLSSCPEIVFRKEDEYFNSGILVMNITQLRKDMVTSKSIAFLQRWTSLVRHADQDALNAISIGKWKKIKSKWNFFVKETRWAEFCSEPSGILHFTGRKKPWIPRFVTTDSELARFHNRYHIYLKRSEWFTPLGWLGFVLNRYYFTTRFAVHQAITKYFGLFRRSRYSVTAE